LYSVCDNGYMPSRISEATREACEQAWPDILASIEAGELVEQACADHGLSRGCIMAYKRDSAELGRQWTAARAASAAALEEEALDTVRKPATDPAHARTRVDTLKWAAAKRNPDHYADRSRHDINVRTIDYTQVLQRAERRLAAQAAGQVIEAEVLRPALAAMRDSSESDTESTS